MRETINAILGLITFLGMLGTICLFIGTSNNTYGIWFIILYMLFKQCVKNTEK